MSLTHRAAAFMVCDMIRLLALLQYVWNPAGENEIPNALVLDVQSAVTF